MSFSNTPQEVEMALHHGNEIPLRQTKIAKAVHDTLTPSMYIVQAGDTVTKVAQVLGIRVPVSLFNVKAGQEWKIIGNSMVNGVTGTSFPISHVANDERFALVA